MSNVPIREMSLLAEEENLEKLYAFLEDSLEQINFSKEVKNKIKIAIEEIFVNISRYAYEDKGLVTVRVWTNEDITIEFEDSGVKYNPLQKEDPDICLTAEERQIGGLGIFLVKKLMDTVEYDHRDGKNILTIKKTIPPKTDN